MLIAGCSPESPLLVKQLGPYLVSTQQGDGGWSDVEETAWCIGYLEGFGDRYSAEIALAKAWLASQRLACGAWGRSPRDRPRIPTTALVCKLAPDVADDEARRWLEREWESDLAGCVQLTYKGGFFLLASGRTREKGSVSLIDRTLDHLIREQEDDGGYGPWKGHPLGSDPWTTGVVLWGLSQFGDQVPSAVSDSAISWLCQRQLANGTWPYHYIDDGTSMALIGIASNMRLIKE